MSGKKLLLIDKDGTLTTSTKGSVFIDAPWHQKPVEGMQQLLTENYNDHTIAIISNQGGIEAGYKSLEHVFLEFRFCLELFPQITEAYFCPDFKGEECWRVWGDCKPKQQIPYGGKSFRKPGAGMIQLAIKIHEASEVVFIGDRPEDEGAAIAAGIKFIHINDAIGDFAGALPDASPATLALMPPQT
jgi:D-glycero-D-manno-heptose 1,7-bisphosphate phosphatase